MTDGRGGVPDRCGEERAAHDSMLHCLFDYGIGVAHWTERAELKITPSLPRLNVEHGEGHGERGTPQQALG